MVDLSVILLCLTELDRESVERFKLAEKDASRIVRIIGFSFEQCVVRPITNRCALKQSKRSKLAMQSSSGRSILITGSPLTKEPRESSPPSSSPFGECACRQKRPRKLSNSLVAELFRITPRGEAAFGFKAELSMRGTRDRHETTHTAIRGIRMGAAFRGTEARR